MFSKGKSYRRSHIVRNAVQATARRFKLVKILTAFMLILSASIALSMALITFGQPLPSSTKTDTSQSGIETARLRPQFDVDVIYAYTGENTYSAGELDSTFNGFEMHPASLYPAIIFLNFTHVSNAKTEACDAELEIYVIEISSDTGQKQSYTCFFGTNYDPAFSGALDIAISQIDSFAGSHSTNGLTGIFTSDMGTNQSLWFKVGSLDSTTSRPSGLGLWSAGEPHAITISVRRIGWIAIDGEAISTSYAAVSDSTQLDLTRTVEGFIFNKLPREKMISEDPFHPIDLYKPLN